jgi:3-hydroxymyristoyl/3-hydroxydecanoyl-(acyl carrier protein) dehydratase
MKKNIVRFFSLMLVLTLAIPFFSGCKEDNKCRLTVKVQDVTNTSIVIPSAKIVISKEQGSVRAEGTTDSKGEAYFTFDNEAILDINVEKKDENNYTRFGKSTVRLIPGETVEKQVLLQQ